MNEFEEALARAPCGLYRVSDALDPSPIAAFCAKRRWAFFLLDCKEVKTKAQFLRAAARALRFPDYFGENWDAFADCLTDLGWIEERGFVVFLKSFDAAASAVPKDMATALEIFQDAASYWNAQRVPFLALIQGRFPASEELPTLL